MSELDEQIAEAERMQRWDYAQFLRRQRDRGNVGAPLEAAPEENDTAIVEGGDVAVETMSAPEESNPE